eukprot:Protomagalhaensia_sp_Gyna_25__4376@NODE_39_length_6608_cov_168_049018_g28_i0_p8_GENE_NODE_39_length_6608_cov_168_049018_g28_i0NODE_39_length_6608_cov_168_049018_g28_i0_p8_ORF_typecomplete_len146_score12_34zfRING_2/PF13639_6/4_6e05zfC3HC4_2/PF13923_6/0_00042zfRING_5/PF14634_6/0_0005Zn_ribbon_17/PF17120_5/0_0022zfANAPC11/PF12861_7/0_0037zfC3HC4/PF00097_25/0_0055ProkRING_4/PF14447_6/0_014zfRING_UBOX/PF13445_6/0_011zfC3H2C3/PF17122_5/0_036zfC3HC4_4/PF15227_6/1_1zfrbx1/PF12678_7/5_1_NODE_39_length_66
MKNTESEPIIPPASRRTSRPNAVSTATSLRHPSRTAQSSPWYLEASHQQPSSCLICFEPICDNFLVFPLCGHSFHWICLQSTHVTPGETPPCPVCEGGVVEGCKSPPHSEPAVQNGISEGGGVFSSIPQAMSRPRDSSLFFFFQV